MNENLWSCERCGRKFDLEKEEGWVALVDEEHFAQMGKLTPLDPYERVCYDCADELLALVEKCNKECWNCEASWLWGLSIMDCLRFQLKFDLLEFPERKRPEKGSLEEAKEVLWIFNPYRRYCDYDVSL